ncbi:aconitase family protein [Paraburkholderia azotifigens]|uniref:Aconitase family protein n=1 Tax=Paraburkholderia azotifigens TaxID=2057004 RepID=A0ABU9RF28_9BURK
MTTLKFDGPILFLSEDANLIDAQLGGRRLTLAEAGKLRDEVSTDEITPVPKMTYYDDRLGSYPYTGFKAGGRFPISKDVIRAGGFSVCVAGKRYGKGSSREHSPFAEKVAGIRLVIADSFERIYRQNADNIGLFTSTDFGLLDRIQAGEEISLEELLAPRDHLTSTILQAGGLLNYGRDKLLNAPCVKKDVPTTSAPKTLAEKIIARHRIVSEDSDDELRPGVGAFVKPDWKYIIEMYTGMATHMLGKVYGDDVPVRDRDSIIAFEDHLSYAHKSAAFLSGIMADFSGLSKAHRDFVAKYEVKSHGYLTDSEGSQGICHPMMTEKYALPGQLVVATDSHTPHSGSVGCVAFGVGTTDMANAFVTGASRFVMPAQFLFKLEGKLASGVTAKDLVLHLLSLPDVRTGVCVGKLVEFAGSAVTHLSTDERATLTNMTAELGGFTGIIAPDAETVRFLKERRGIDFEIEDWMRSDDGAVYETTITVQCSALTPMVAAPGDPGNGIALTSVVERPHVDIAYGGSCTGGKRADFDQYHEVLAWAAERGLKVPDGTALYLQFGTLGVRQYCEENGYIEAFERVGATMLMPSCGACANLGPGGSTSPEQVTVSAQNRNFPGRSGPGKIWVASPATVAASAIAGRLVSFSELEGSLTVTA